MNSSYRSLWNDSTGTFVAVPENASSAGKKTSSGVQATGSGARYVLQALAVSVMLAFGTNALALPSDGVVASGAATISSGTTSTTITQSTQNAIINWQSFNIAAGQSVQFVQPTSSSVTLNRVVGADPSSILGSMSANGKVFLINPNGILFGQNASVNVGGLVVSTLNMTDADFNAGTYKFSGNGTGSVVNQGSLNAAGGYVALLGAKVSNQGTISAQLGSVVLAAGSVMTMDVAGDGLLNIAVTEGAVDALVENGGLIRADGGRVLLTTQAAGSLLANSVNNTGVIQAQTLVTGKTGSIMLMGGMETGTVNVGGTLDASAPVGGDGGFIETSAAYVKIANDVRITTAAAAGQTGTWLIDPVDFVIAASGGDMTGAALSSQLVSNNVTILSTAGSGDAALGQGDITVADSVNWSANRLTLNALNDININTAMTGTGTASLALLYGQAAVASGNTSNYNVLAPVNLPAGQNFSTTLGSNGVTTNYTVITSLGAEGSLTTTDLQGISGNLAGHYALGSDINAEPTSAWADGFNPIGNIADPFSGNFDGLGHTITSLTIARPSTDNVGLFGYVVSTGGAMLKNVTLAGGSVTGGSYVGTLAGHINGDINNSHTTQAVTGQSYVGDLVGWSTGNIINSSATGAVAATGDYVGGLVGWITGDIICCYATGSVSSNGSYVGGLVGWITGDIDRSYATGSVTTQAGYVGGLAGWSTGDTSNSYAQGGVDTNGSNVGGLIGWLADISNISKSYSSGLVRGDTNTGGLVGQKISGGGGTVTNSFWDTTTSNQANSAGGFGMITSAMRDQLNFTTATAANGQANPAWDFANLWVMPSPIGASYPNLQACLAPATWAAVPSVVPPVIVVPPVLPPGETTDVVDTDLLPEMPYEGPVVNQRTPLPYWAPLVVLADTPAQLQSLTPPVVYVPPVPVELPPVAPKEEVIETPVQPPVYVAPVRPRKQDRN